MVTLITFSQTRWIIWKDLPNVFPQILLGPFVRCGAITALGIIFAKNYPFFLYPVSFARGVLPTSLPLKYYDSFLEAV